jgi:SRSO17 transposase
MLAKVGELVLPAIERSGPVEVWIIDDTGFPKKGRHSVGVTRQYCGQLGKQDNCQVAVTLSLANQARRHKAKIPETMAFHTKPEIALEQIKAARIAALPQGVVLMDAGYGNDTSLQTEITALDMSYVAGIGPNTSVWPPGVAPLLPQTRSARGRPQTRLQRDEAHQPVTVKALALSLPEEVWQTIAWRRGARIGSHRALPASACGRHIVITC